MPTPSVSDIAETHERAWGTLAGPGDWLSGSERVSVALQVREARSCGVCAKRAASLSPFGGEHHPSHDPLNHTEVDTVHRVSVDAKRLTRGWSEEVVAEIGEERYTEIVGLVACVTMLDEYRRAMGEPLDPIPSPHEGVPKRMRPAEVGDIGAWVSQTVEKRAANVSRALSLVPVTEALFAQIESWQYSRGTSFMALEWTDRALSRPQIELVAATTASINECFY